MRKTLELSKDSSTCNICTRPEKHFTLRHHTIEGTMGTFCSQCWSFINELSREYCIDYYRSADMVLNSAETEVKHEFWAISNAATSTVRVRHGKSTKNIRNKRLPQEKKHQEGINRGNIS